MFQDVHLLQRGPPVPPDQRAMPEQQLQSEVTARTLRGGELWLDQRVVLPSLCPRGQGEAAVLGPGGEERRVRAGRGGAAHGTEEVLPPGQHFRSGRAHGSRCRLPSQRTEKETPKPSNDPGIRLK